MDVSCHSQHWLLLDIFILIYYCFRDHSSGAVFLYNADSVAFRNCSFLYNRQTQHDNFLGHCYPSSNIYFSDSGPTAGAISVYSRNQTLSLLVSGCHFEGNSPMPNPNTTLQRALLVFGHGGAMFVRLLETVASNVCIEDSTFADNMAEVNGGALQLSAITKSSRNAFMFLRTNFTNNSCTLHSCTGGAIAIDYFQESLFNQMHFDRCLFSDNMAYSGGALALLTTVGTEPDEDEVKPLFFLNCLFRHNLAQKDGSVLSIFSVALINELGFPIFIEGW